MCPTATVHSPSSSCPLSVVHRPPTTVHRPVVHRPPSSFPLSTDSCPPRTVYRLLSYNPLSLADPSSVPFDILPSRLSAAHCMYAGCWSRRPTCTVSETVSARHTLYRSVCDSATGVIGRRRTARSAPGLRPGAGTAEIAGPREGKRVGLRVVGDRAGLRERGRESGVESRAERAANKRPVIAPRPSRCCRIETRADARSRQRRSALRRLTAYTFGCAGAGRAATGGVDLGQVRWIGMQLSRKIDEEEDDVEQLNSWTCWASPCQPVR